MDNEAEQYMDDWGELVAVRELHRQMMYRENELVIRLRDQGVSWREIGRALDMTAQGAWSAFHDLGQLALPGLEP